MRASIITPSFNRAGLLDEAAQSIFAQTYADWEWMIVDDGSTDGALEKILGYAAKDPRVKAFVRDREPKGAAACRNIAVEKCTGDYVLFLDTDDLLAPFCIQQRIETARANPGADVLAFQNVLFQKKPYDLGIIWNLENGTDDVMRLLYADTVFSGSGTFWKKESFTKIGGWNEELSIWQDVELHIRAYMSGLKFVKRLDLPADLHVRVSDTSISRTGYNTISKLQSRIKVFTAAKDYITAAGFFEKYKPGLRAMFLSIFENAVNAPQFAIGQSLLVTAAENNLFSAKEIGLLKTYIRGRKLKMYKFPPLQRYFERKLNALKPAYKKTLCTLPYKKEELV